MIYGSPCDPFTSTRKVYAAGARVGEVPLVIEQSRLVETGKAFVTVSQLRRARRRMFRRLPYGAIRGFAPLCMDSNDPYTVECSFKKRLFRDLLPPESKFLGSFRHFVRKWVRDHIPQVQIMDLEEWLGSTGYSEARKAELRLAYDKGHQPSRHKASHIDTFVKTESYPEYKHARMINSRSDAFKAWSGPRFKAIENAVYRIHHFIKHVPVPDRVDVIRSLKQAGLFYYSTDFTAYESHFTAELMDACECELYRHCLAGDEGAEFLCSVLTGTNRMRTRTGHRAECTARRMSGDMCTSLGNGFTNLMLVLYIVDQKGGSVDGYVEGDDGIFASSVELTSEDYAKCGFTIKIERIPDPCCASFCGLVFANSGEIIRDPFRFMNGFGWTSSFINAGPKIMNELLRAKALSAVYECPQCPIVSVLARRALDKTVGFAPRFVEDGYHHRVPSDVRKIVKFDPGHDTRELFERLYSIPVVTQLAIEELINSDQLEEVARILHPHADVEHYASHYLEIA